DGVHSDGPLTRFLPIVGFKPCNLSSLTGLEVKQFFSTSGRGRSIFLDIPLYRTGDFTQNRVVGEMTIFPNYAQLPPYRPSGADDSEVILHPPSATEPGCIRPSVYQIASGSNEILCCVGQGLPSVEPARKIGNVAKPGAPQDTGRDRAQVAALAMDDEQFAAIQLRDSIRQLSQGNPDGILHSAGLDFTGLADIQYRNVVLLFFQQVREFLHRDLGNVIQLIAA